MVETYQLQQRRNRNRLDELACEITDAVSLEQQNEYERSSWLYLIQYINKKLESRQSLFTAAIPKSRGRLRWGHPEHQALGYEILLGAAKCINAPNLNSLTLQDLVDYMSERKLLSDDNPALNIQAVFHIVGWLTGVWDPEWNGLSDQSSFEAVLKVKSGRIPGQRRYYWFNQQAVRQTQIPIEEVQARQIHHIMGGAFGELLPRPEQALRARDARTLEGDLGGVQRAYFSWQAVSQLGYRISWTSTLNEHLQVDQRHKVLFVYQHPSLCWLLYKRQGSNLLTRFFSEEQKERALQDGQAFDGLFGIDDFFDDLLRSYRLIFAPGWIPWMRSSGQPSLNLLPDGCDPLLRILCFGGRDNDVIASLEHDLEDPVAVGAFVNLDEFPFLGQRLGTLSRIGRGSHNPHSLWKLWVERSNLNGYTYRWIIFFLALGALLLQFAQTVASMVQMIRER